MASDNQGLYTEKDLEILEEIKDLRLNIVRANKKNALEGDSRAARLINELSSSVESSIHTQGKMMIIQTLRKMGTLFLRQKRFFISVALDLTG